MGKNYINYWVTLNLIFKQKFYKAIFFQNFILLTRYTVELDRLNLIFYLKMAEFFLTKNILNKIINRNVLFERPLILNYNYGKAENVFDPEYPVILLIRDIIYFEKENILGIEIFDGCEVMDDFWWTGASLAKSKWYSVHRSFTNNIPGFSNPLSLHYNCQNKHHLTIGSVIILTNYTFENIMLSENPEVEDDHNLEKYYLEDVLHIIDFHIIGHNFDIKSTFQYSER
jgi:hypothetical protein